MSISPSTLPAPAAVTPPSAAEAPKPPEYNRTGVDYAAPMPRPPVRGPVIDFHCHLLAARHGRLWYDTARHFGIDCFVSMTPLEEAVGLQREFSGQIHFIAVPAWGDKSTDWVDQWLRRLEAFYNLGSRIIKFHCAPGSLKARGVWLDSPMYDPIFREVRDRKMAVMTHIGDPETWYAGKYADAATWGSRAEHYQMWENVLQANPGVPWVGAHMGGNPENLARLQDLLDRYPNLNLDNSATKWMVREISARRDAAREFFIRNQDRLLFGSDQVSSDDRGFDFLASRWWCHRKLWETAYIAPSPIFDPDLPADQQPMLRGLALPTEVLQKIYHDNSTRFLDRLGIGFEPRE
jgi:hypothetical protein